MIPTETVLPITSPEIRDRGIGFVATCTALLPPARSVRLECGQPTTSVRLVEYRDGTRRWRSVCQAHTEGPL